MSVRTTSVARNETIEITIAPKNTDQKPSTANDSPSDLASHAVTPSRIALMTSTNSPNVTAIRQHDTNVASGRSSRFTIAKSAVPAISEIRDQGAGITREDRERIFEPYFRVRGPGSETVPGSGLGLAVAKRLIEAQGGRIWVEDAEDGPGARFCIDIRAAAERT